MPNLHWTGKQAVIDHLTQVALHQLERVPMLSCGTAASGNAIVEGDNLLALRALLPSHGGRIKCIYIDPPYNTGAAGWIYDDNVNAPQIRRWLGEVVGTKEETLDRHDRWLCMMYPRLVLLRDLLSTDASQAATKPPVSTNTWLMGAPLMVFRLNSNKFSAAGLA